MLDGFRMKRISGFRSDARTGGARTTFGELASLYLDTHGPKLSSSWRSAAEGMLRLLDPVFRDRVVSTIRRADIEEYRNVRQAEGAANGSINREVALLGVVLTFGGCNDLKPEPSADVNTKKPEDQRRGLKDRRRASRDRRRGSKDRRRG
jgi:hypothetical protein